MKLTDERIDAVLGEAYTRLVAETGYNGGMGGETWDKAAARAIEAEVLRINGLGGDGSGPPFGSKRKAAMAIYKPPFKFVRGYIYDSASNMVADQDGFDGKVADAVTARVRGWGRIGYMPNPEELQDEVGQMMADALTAYYATPQPQQAAPGAVQEGWKPIETAPKDGTIIAVRGDNHGDSELGQHYCIASWFNGCWAESSDWNPTSELTFLTHWTPLPASTSAPKPQGE